MMDGKGTDDFDAYVQNIQHAVVSASTGRQLSGYGTGAHGRQTLVLNPYVATVAQMGILRFRSPAGGGR